MPLRLFIISLTACFTFTLSACSPNINGTYGSGMATVVIEDGKFKQRTLGTEVEFDYKVDDNKIIVEVSEQANLIYRINEAGDLVGPMGITFKKQAD